MGMGLSLAALLFYMYAPQPEPTEQTDTQVTATKCIPEQTNTNPSAFDLPERTHVFPEGISSIYIRPRNEADTCWLNAGAQLFVLSATRTHVHVVVEQGNSDGNGCERGKTTVLTHSRWLEINLEVTRALHEKNQQEATDSLFP
jgi:hypothetical protein